MATPAWTRRRGTEKRCLDRPLRFNVVVSNPADVDFAAYLTRYRRIASRVIV